MSREGLQRVARTPSSRLPTWAKVPLRRLYGHLQNLQRKLVRLRYRLSRNTIHQKWKDALPEEVLFWRDYIVKQGGPWSEEYRQRLDPSTPLEPEITDLLDAPPGAPIAILDVGAGPLTILGKFWEARTVTITAVDPLAVHYDQLLSEFGVTPPIRTQAAEAERLLDHFAPDQFDLVHSRNALDHSYNPMLAIRQMVVVVKPEHHVLLRHYVNEGEHNDYRQLHQWNFCEENGKFVIGNYWNRYCVDDELRGVAEVQTCVIRKSEDPRDTWLVVTIKKKSQVPDSDQLLQQ